MVSPDMRLSPVYSARANALRGQWRTADPIPHWLRVVCSHKLLVVVCLTLRIG
jgi:hypothetical protein